jgi:hypothetical protein
LINLATQSVVKTYPPGTKGPEKDADKRAKEKGSPLEYTTGKKAIQL